MFGGEETENSYDKDVISFLSGGGETETSYDKEVLSVLFGGEETEKSHTPVTFPLHPMSTHPKTGGRTARTCKSSWPGGLRRSL